MPDGGIKSKEFGTLSKQRPKRYSSRACPAELFFQKLTWINATGCARHSHAGDETARRANIAGYQLSQLRGADAACRDLAQVRCPSGVADIPLRSL